MNAPGVWSRLLRDRASRWCLGFLLAVSLASLFAPLLPLPSPSTLALQDEPAPPVPPWRELFRRGYRAGIQDFAWPDARLAELRERIFGDVETAPWLGTDSKGRDLLARVLWGSRTSILAALAAALASLAIGVTLGAIAGLSGPRTDNLMMRAVDGLQSLPFVFLVIFLIGLVDAHRAELSQRFGIDREVVFYLVIGAVSWLTMARVVRGQVLLLRRSAFVEAARVSGASAARILRVHVLPNILPVVIVSLTLTIPTVMLTEAFLSFLGLGIEPPKVSWGILAADGIEAINPIRIAWWLVVAPAAAMGSVLFALTIVGDGLRDALDPRLSRQ
ncbi:MAG TPA: ABC transporter permease [Thermoanaerobaculia bacterium]|nr:ABC transporter permease [Thermoanaerobaculia bacterium]